jgi:hypothetical protein
MELQDPMFMMAPRREPDRKFDPDDRHHPPRVPVTLRILDHTAGGSGICCGSSDLPFAVRHGGFPRGIHRDSSHHRGHDDGRGGGGGRHQPRSTNTPTLVINSPRCGADQRTVVSSRVT